MKNLANRGEKGCEFGGGLCKSHPEKVAFSVNTDVPDLLLHKHHLLCLYKITGNNPVEVNSGAYLIA